ncbi:MAG: peptidylprolyl isomerase [Planctomycetota bacterium]
MRIDRPRSFGRGNWALAGLLLLPWGVADAEPAADAAAWLERAGVEARRVTGRGPELTDALQVKGELLAAVAARQAALGLEAEAERNRRLVRLCRRALAHDGEDGWVIAAEAWAAAAAGDDAATQQILVQITNPAERAWAEAWLDGGAGDGFPDDATLRDVSPGFRRQVLRKLITHRIDRRAGFEAGRADPPPEASLSGDPELPGFPGEDPGRRAFFALGVAEARLAPLPPELPPELPLELPPVPPDPVPEPPVVAEAPPETLPAAKETPAPTPVPEVVEVVEVTEPEAPPTPAEVVARPVAPPVVPDLRRLADPSAVLDDAPAPAVYDVEVVTTKGVFTVRVTRAWAPAAADRFHDLARSGYYHNQRFFRVVEGFVVQWGIHGFPRVAEAWRPLTFPDEPRRRANVRGTVAFAAADVPDSRNTQVFVNLGDHAFLDELGFVPFGRVTAGLDVVASLYAGHGDTPSQQQPRIQREGNAYLDATYPELDSVVSVSVTPVVE